ncbi:MAG: hypothetical protein J5965_23340 [Aeriscardovia sp.]|nr:hypothetical protein [Aeriscardovia sp.]
MAYPHVQTIYPNGWSTTPADTTVSAHVVHKDSRMHFTTQEQEDLINETRRHRAKHIYDIIK